ncbi:SAR1012 family small protein [Staphylococcus capitis]|nr:SAR1012 family small protein [Staphylococcus capitis]
MDIIRRVFRILITGYIVKAIRNNVSEKSRKSNNGNDNKNKEK